MALSDGFDLPSNDDPRKLPDPSVPDASVPPPPAQTAPVVVQQPQQTSAQPIGSGLSGCNLLSGGTGLPGRDGSRGDGTAPAAAALAVRLPAD